MQDRAAYDALQSLDKNLSTCVRNSTSLGKTQHMTATALSKVQDCTGLATMNKSVLWANPQGLPVSASSGIEDVCSKIHNRSSAINVARTPT